MLIYTGLCLSCHSRDVEYNKNGVSKSFTAHRCCMHDPNSNSDPLYIETGEVPLEKGKCYQIAVRVTTYTKKNGETVIQYQTYKDYPPRELNAKAA